MATIDFPTSPSEGQTYSSNNKTWQWNGNGWKAVLSSGTINTAQRQVYTATAGQTLFSTPSTYVQGANQVSLFINGVRQYNTDYTEVSNSSVSLSTGAAANDSVLIEINSYTGQPLVINTPTIINQSGVETTGYLNFSTANTGQLTTISTDSANLTYNVVTGYLGTKGIRFSDGSTQLTAGGAPNTIYSGTSNVAFTGANGNTVVYVNNTLAATISPVGVSFPATTTSTSSSTGALVVGGGLGVAGNVYTGSSITANGPITANGLITASQSGFQSATYSAGRNRIWSFGNADTYGISYFQGSGGYGGTTDMIGMHFGTASVAASQFSFVSSGNFYATGSGTFFYSDKRLKTEISKIEGALDKIDQLTGIIYTQNKLAETYGYKNYDEQVGLYAQDVQKVQPQAVKPAPFDVDSDGTSKSGENYLTVQYEKLIPLLVEGIKELRAEIRKLKGE